MVPIKKYFTDSLIQLAIVLSLLRTDLNNLLNTGISSYPEVQEIMLGQSLAYTQTNFHSHNIYSGVSGIGHIHPKAVDSYYSDAVFQEIRRLTRQENTFSQDVISAWLVNQETNSPQPVAETPVTTVAHEPDSNNELDNNNNSNDSSNNQEDPLDIQFSQNAVGPNEVDFLFTGSELTKEDMDLIDVLWRQDIDLGIGREVFDPLLRQELEKEKEIDLLKEKEKEKLLKLEEQDQEPSWESLNCTVDGETGELIPLPSSDVETLSGNQSPTFSPLQGNEESMSIEDALQQMIDHQQSGSNITTLSDLVHNADVQSQLENLIQQAQQNASQYNRQNSLEQRWSDIASLLNLTSNSTQLAEPVISPQAPNALIRNASFAPQSPNNNFVSVLTELESAPSSFIPPTISNNTDNVFAMEDEELFPNVTGVSNTASHFNQSEYLPNMMTDDMDMTHMSLGDGIGNLHLCDGNDSAVSSMGSVSSPDWNDTSSNSSEMMPAYEGLEGATGGSYGSSGYVKVKHENYDYGYYASSDDGSPDMHMNMSAANHTHFDFSPAQPRHILHNHSYPLQPGQQPRERKPIGRDKTGKTLSRDQKRARGMKLPFTVDQIIHSPVEEFNELIQKYSLNEAQLSLTRDIRRRGKNKVAAQNCRKRKMDVIVTLEGGVDQMRLDRDTLSKQNDMFEKEARELKDKFSYLYQELFSSLRDENGRPYNPHEYSLQQTADGNVFLVPKNSTQNNPQERILKKRKGDKK